MTTAFTIEGSTGASDPIPSRLTKITQELETACGDAKSARIRAAYWSFGVNATFCVSLCLGFVGALIAFFAGAPLIVLIVVGIRLAISIGDTACSALVWRHRHNSDADEPHPYLPRGGDCVGNLAYGVLRLFNVEPIAALSYARATSYAVMLAQGCATAAILPLGLADLTLPTAHWYFTYIQPFVAWAASTANEYVWEVHRSAVHAVAVKEEGVECARRKVSKYDEFLVSLRVEQTSKLSFGVVPL